MNISKWTMNIIRDEILDIRRRLKENSRGKLESLHMVKKVRLLLRSRTLSQKRKRMLQRSRRFYQRQFNCQEQEKREMFKHLIRLEKDFFTRTTDKAVR